MTAHTPIRTDAISTFVPWAAEEERKVRQRLLKAQALASGHVAACRSPRARACYWLIVDTAAERAFSPGTCDELREIADGLVRLFMVAGMFERTEGGE